MTLRLFAAAWEEYRRRVVPAGAGRAQLEGTEWAFYGGASAFLGILMRNLEPGTEDTPPDLALMDALAAELREHADKVRSLVKPCGRCGLTDADNGEGVCIGCGGVLR